MSHARDDGRLGRCRVVGWYTARSATLLGERLPVHQASGSVRIKLNRRNTVCGEHFELAEMRRTKPRRGTQGEDHRVNCRTLCADDNRKKSGV